MEMLLYEKHWIEAVYSWLPVISAIHPISSNQKQPLSSPLNESTH